MSASDAVMDFFEPVLGPGWQMQFGHWQDSADKRQRYAVLRPTGGAKAELLRTPLFNLSLIGMDGGDLEQAKEAADRCVEAARASAGSLVLIETGEPAYIPTADGRPVFELAVSAITT